MNEDEFPLLNLATKLGDEENVFTEDEKETVKSLTSDTENMVKASLANLLMGEFSKVASYNKLASKIMKLLSDRAEGMDTNELILFFDSISKSSNSQSRNLMDMFKKQGGEINEFLKQLKKLNEIEEEAKGKKDNIKTIDLNEEKKEKVLDIINKMKGKSEDSGN